MSPQTGPDVPDDPRRRSRRLRTGAAATAAAVTLAAGIWAAVGVGGGTPSAAAGDLPPKLDTVRRQTLRDTRTVTGTLGYGHARLLAARNGGTVTWLPDAGEVIRQGGVLFGVDDRPVVLLHGALPAYRTMREGTQGRDVAQLERDLAALGFRDFTVDGRFTAGTAEAVRAWQRRLGLPSTGVVAFGQVVFAAADLRVSALSADLGDPAPAGKPVLSLTGTSPQVTVDLDVSDQRLAKEGAAVTVTLPDATRLAGKIDSVTTVVRTEQDGNGESKQVTSVEVEVALAKPAAGFDSAAVDVGFTAGERKDVLTVPVTALTALAEGGYGVEVVSGTRHSFVAVRTGLFADSRVEVTGVGITEGTQVGVPS